jgi:uncharacterized caspase-like protein
MGPARCAAAVLARLGFAALRGVGLDRLAMEDLVAAFARAAADADTALAYSAAASAKP